MPVPAGLLWSQLPPVISGLRGQSQDNEKIHPNQITWEPYKLDRQLAKGTRCLVGLFPRCFCFLRLPLLSPLQVHLTPKGYYQLYHSTHLAGTLSCFQNGTHPQQGEIDLLACQMADRSGRRRL